MKDKQRVAAYCRVSTDKEDQANSLTSQMKYFTEYISQNEDWQLYEVFYDEGISGTSVAKRAGFNRMISEAMSGRIDRILTKEVSRFARNTVDTLSYTRQLKEAGVGVLFMADNIDTKDTDGELRLSIMATIAQEESRKTSERVKWGQKRRMEQGVVFGRDMLGYAVREGKLIMNPDEAEIVKLIYHKFLIEEKGTHVIARELREAGIRPKRVKEWSNTVILRVLRNEKYIGDLCQKKTFTPNYLTHSKKYNRGNEDVVYIKDHHEPIIDRDTWENTQKELLRRSPTDEQKSKHSNRYWCSGKLVCGECGQRFVSRTKTLKGGDIYKAWRCYAAANHGTAKADTFGNAIGCNSASVNEQVLLACVGYVIRHIQKNKDKLIKDMLKEIKTVQSIETDIDTAPIYAQIEAITDKKRRAIDLVLEGAISKENLQGQVQYYDDQIADLTTRIDNAKNINIIHEQQVMGIQNYMAEISRMMEMDAGNELLYREMLDRIVVYNQNTVVVYLNCVPFGVRLQYKTSGRGEQYKVTISKVDIIDD